MIPQIEAEFKIGFAIAVGAVAPALRLWSYLQPTE